MRIIIGILAVIIIIQAFIMWKYQRQIKDICRQLSFLMEHDSNKLIQREIDMGGIGELSDKLNELLDLRKKERNEYRKKEELIADTYTNLSHDIRTPLTSLDGYFQLIEECDNIDDQRRYLDIIRERLNSLNEMLEELFTFTKLKNDSYKLELTDYACKSAELCYEIPDFRDCNNKGDGYRMVYVMKYVRAFDGVFVDNEGGYMFLDNDDEQKIWEGERINVYVNDDGIVGFDYIAPLELGETVKDDCSLKSFDEIKTVFEDGITTLYNSGMEKLLDMDGKEVEYTDMGDKEDVKYTDIKVNKIILRYTRLSERSDFHTGLMVPVWDFIGDIDYGDTSGLSGQEKDKVVFTINAVDGSIVDRAAGY